MNKPTKFKQQLETEGWKLASVTGGAHLERTLQMYQELGIEVFLEEAKPEECEGCTECYQAGNEIICRVYTRAKDERAQGQPNTKD